MKVIQSAKFDTVGGLCGAVVKSIPNVEHRRFTYVIGPNGEYLTRFNLEEYELTDGSKVQNIRLLPEPNAEPVVVGSKADAPHDLHDAWIKLHTVVRRIDTGDSDTTPKMIAEALEQIKTLTGFINAFLIDGAKE